MRAFVVSRLIIAVFVAITVSVIGFSLLRLSGDLQRARKIGRALRAGGVHLNYPAADFNAPFGGYKRSGNGREWGEAGLREFLEVKAMVGYGED